ncbi:DMT family transporter [Sporosarcina sp. ACRSL]|uniref:DMT family transporter n=1 Tax=Sporosarcina sp. ACRSL TaxID=2918215 RepID=UPI001EF75268|nr:DMT family transporter [Sporosarcina sp. ACRSL]MCG7344723.1 DMT family transporter [Sporosarcina sp. ACRSL]
MPRSVYLSLLVLSMIWGGSYYFIKILLEVFEPWTIVFFRSTLGLVTIILIMLLMRKSFELKKIPWVWMTVVAAVNTAIPWAIIGFSEIRLTSNMAALLNSTTPLLSLLLGILFFGTKAVRWHWVGISIGIIGLMILLGLKTNMVYIDIVGGIGMIVASLFYGLGSHLSKSLLKGLSPFQATLGTLFFTSIISGIVAISTEDIPLTKVVTPINLFVLIGLGIFGSGVAYILFYFIVNRGTPVIATTVTYLIPVFSLVWGTLFLNESIHLNMIIGALLIMSGIFLTGKNSGKKEGIVNEVENAENVPLSAK